ncbi:MAG TPA: hypothetical protein VHL11_11740 [Phototrophicaceae bacterium]|jgi:WD40 repeat protein|nr:hypothetical protein [Phototrophicaceae bacterium]
MSRRNFMIWLVLVLLLSAFSFSTLTMQSDSNLEHHLAFSSTGRDGTLDIFIMNDDGTHVINLTNSPEDEYTPHWSPDGSKITFTKFIDDHYDIYTIGVNDAQLTRLTEEMSDNFTPLWSPDGSKIIFVSTRDGNSEIYTMNVDGNDQVRLTNTEVGEYVPVWSPDGTQIAFINDSTEAESVYLMDANGSNVRVIPNTAGRNTGPVWSLDGKLAFSIDTPDESTLYTINPDGLGRTEIDHRQHGYAYNGMTWYPNEKLAFFAHDSSTQELIVYDPATVTRLIITGRHIDEGRYPAWSPALDTSVPEPTATVPQPDPRFDPAPECPNSPSSRLGQKMIAMASLPDEGEVRQNLRVRASPGGEQVASLEAGTQFRLVDEGSCGDDGLIWWEIETLDGKVHGYSAEALLPDNYLMTPVGTPTLQYGNSK